jgi:AraC family transcriptional activator of pobA
VDERFRLHEPLHTHAAALGITVGQLSRLCRQVLGRSALAVVNQRLLHEAERELAYSTLSIKQLAASLGFEDESYFGRFFRRHAGLTPTQFRQQAHARLTGSCSSV